MATQNIVNLSTGQIDPKYIPALPPVATPTLNDVLTAGNQTGGILIDAQGGNVMCDALKCISIECATAPLFNEIAVDADLISAQYAKTGFAVDAKITCNEQISEKSVIETENATTDAIYKIAEGNMKYETLSKVLTINPLTMPPSPLIPNQGLVVNGSITAPLLGTAPSALPDVVGYDSSTGQFLSQPAGGGGWVGTATSNLDMNNYEIINSSDITVKGAVPGINFQNTAGVDKGDLTYIELIDTLRLQSSKVLINTNNSKDYIIAMNEGILNQFEISAKDKPIRIIRNDSTGLAPDTELTFEAGGKVKLSSAVSDPVTLRLENAGGKYGEIVASETNGTLSVKAQAGYGLELESTAGITMKPATGIVEIIGDSATPVYPTVKFTDPTTTNTVDWAMTDLGAGRPILSATGAHFIGANIGANQSFSIGHEINLGVNCAIGADSGITRISNGNTSLPTDYIQLEYDTSTSLGKATIRQTESITLTNGGEHALKQTPTATEIIGDINAGQPPLLQFVDSSAIINPPVDILMRVDNYGFNTPEITTNASFFSVSSGAIEGVVIGTNTTENFIMGYGAPLKISNSIGTLPLQYIELQNTNNISLYTADSLALDKTASVNIDPANSIQLTINDVPSGLGTTMTMSATGSIFDSGAAGTDTVFQVIQNGGTAEFNLSASGGSYTCLLSAENGIDLLAANGQIRGNNAEGTWDMYKPAYGQFSSSATQNASAGGTKLLFNTTVIAVGIAIGATTSRITPVNPGIYKIAYSIQLAKAGAGSATGSIWIARSNSNQSNTNRRFRLGGADSLPVSSDFLISITAGQYIEVILQSTDTTVEALAVAVALPIPATPSIIFTMERVA